MFSKKLREKSGTALSKGGALASGMREMARPHLATLRDSKMARGAHARLEPGYTRAKTRFITDPRMRIWYLYFTAFMAGMTVLTLELLGSRIIAPFFGNTLYVWSSLISVAIASLAMGYYFGGWLADKRPSFDLLYVIVMIIGVAIIIIPRIDAFILTHTITLGVRFGPFIAVSILFAIPIMLLGSIAPFAIRLATEELKNVGKTAGSLYATETLGGFFGSILTGFFLIPEIGIVAIATLFASLLFLISAIWFIAYGLARRLLYLLPVLPLLLLPTSVNSGNDKVLYHKQSIAGEIKVVDRFPQRVLLVEGATQAWAEQGTLTTSSSFAQKIPFIYFVNPNIKDALVLGLGSGLLSALLEDNWGLTVDSVDINEDILHVARTYFGFQGTAIIEDARAYIRRTPKKYDAAIFDMAHGDGYPSHTFTQEAFREIQSILNPGGILMINFNGPAHSRKVLSVYRTLSSVFEDVIIFTNADPEEALSPKFFLATDHKIDREQVEANIHKYGSEDQFMEEVYVNVWHNHVIDSLDTKGGVLLTDDYNPLDNYQVDTTIAWRERNWRDFGNLLLR